MEKFEKMLSGHRDKYFALNEVKGVDRDLYFDRLVVELTDKFLEPEGLDTLLSGEGEWSGVNMRRAGEVSGNGAVSDTQCGYSEEDVEDIGESGESSEDDDEVEISYEYE